MKTIFTLLTILLLTFNQLFAQAKTTVIVIDKSDKIEDKTLLKQLHKRVQTIVWNACQKNGDRILISYIYENSGSMTNKTEFTLTLSSLDISKLSPQKQKLMRRRFEAIIKQKRIAFVEKVTKKALSFNDERPRSYILDMLPLFNNFKQNYGKYDLHIISDLIEFSTYRNLNRTKFTSVYSAKKLGQIDAEKIAKKFSLRKTFLQDISISIYFPVSELENRPIFEWLPYYWGSIFQIYGANSTTIKYSKL